jgi:raffinose/stachyose/melibiose transport system substrate-binding protein
MKKSAIKTVVVLLLIIACLFSFGSCGGKKTAGEAGGGERVKIRYYSLWTPSDVGEASELYKMYDEFRAANPDVELEVISDAHEAWATKIKTMMTANDLPEVFISQPSDFSVYVDSGVYYDFTGDLNADPEWKNSFLSGSLDTMSKNGRVYGISWSGYVEGIYYNQKLFDQFGLDFPKTYDELINCVKTFKANGITSFAVGAKDGWPVTMTTQFLMDREAGYDLFEKGCVDGSVSMAVPEYLRAMEKFLELVNLGAFSEGVLGATGADAESLFLQGRAAMIINGSWMTSAIDEFEGGEFAKNVHFGNFPTISGGKGVQDALCAGFGKAFCIGSKTPEKQREAALRFIKFICNSKSSARFLENVSIITALRPSNPNLDKISPLMKEVTDLSGSVHQTWMAYGELITPGFYDEMNKLGQQMLLNAVSAQEAVDILERARLEFQINF